MEDVVSGVRVSGPLEPYAAGFAVRLAEDGYRPASVTSQVRVLAHLSHWLDLQCLAPEGLTEGRAAEFAAERRAAGFRQWVSLRGLGPLLGYLRAEGAVPGPAEPARETALLERYRCYLVSERGLAPGTVRYYADGARLFLHGREESLPSLAAADITGFTLAECRRRPAGSAKLLVTALRSVLRFLAAEGLAPPGLEAAVPAVAGTRGTGLSRALPGEQVDALLASCRDGSAPGRLRDFSVLVLLARLGLRAGEAAALELDDIDWRAGTVVIRGKGRRDETLPLPADAGEALASWLRDGRPAGFAGRQVFTTLQAPLRGMSAEAVKASVARACKRAGTGPAGAHRLRHSAAARMLEAGAPLEEIGQVLRHRSAATTAIYATADPAALAALALPWPGEAA